MHLGARLLLLAAVVVLAGCVAAPVQNELEEPSDTELSFTEVTADAGFQYESADRGMGNGNDGLYVTDYDNDLREDILAIGGSEPVLFRNTDGKFERTGAIPTVSGTIQGALFFDHDNDGWEDLLILRRGETPVFLENREGSFRKTDVGLNDELSVPVGASAADYTGNGCLDLFIIQYGDWSETTPYGWQSQLPFEMEDDNGHPNALYRGSCGEFDLVDDAGIEGVHWSLATSFVDLNGDDRPDIHVANDYYNDTIYYNNGDATFNRTVLGSETDRNGMSSTVADITGNGHSDIFVTNIYFPRDSSDLTETERRLFKGFRDNRLGKRMHGNNLLVGTDSGFEFAGEEAGVDEGGWGWAAITTDFDSSGQQDLFHTTQRIMRFNKSEPVYTSPMLWIQEDNEFYRQHALEIGFSETDGRGAVHADFDHTGSADVAIATFDGQYHLYRNDGPQGNSLQVRVKGNREGTAIGARVYVVTDNRTQVQLNDDKTDYQSQSTRFLHFGVGDSVTVNELRIVWPDGTERTFEDVETGQRLLVAPDGITDRLSYQEAEAAESS